jgi:hypothetical protein
MNILAAINDGMKAIKAGEELRTASAWKSAQAVTSLLVAAGGLISAIGIDVPFTPEFYSSAGATIAGIVNAYLTVATTKRIGV